MIWNTDNNFKPEIMTNDELFKLIEEDIEFEREWLHTLDGDEVESISVENVIGILKRRLNIKN